MSKTTAVETCVAADDSSHGDTLKRKLLLTVREVAFLLSMSERSIWTRSGTGEIPRPIKIGRSKRWIREEIESFLDNLKGRKSK